MAMAGNQVCARPPTVPSPLVSTPHSTSNHAIGATFPHTSHLGFLAGERNYAKLQSDTGVLVYLAGFLYVYAGIKYINGGDVFSAQIVLGVLYVINLTLVLLIYIRAQVVGELQVRSWEHFYLQTIRTLATASSLGSVVPFCAMQVVQA